MKAETSLAGGNDRPHIGRNSSVKLCNKLLVIWSHLQPIADVLNVPEINDSRRISAVVECD